MSIPDLTANNLFDTLKGKNAVVTGGGSGLGQMMATSLIQNGANVIISSRKEASLKEVSDELNSLGKGKCYYVVADLGAKSGMDHLVSETKKVFDKLHILVNNSGMSWGAPFDNFPEKNGWDRLFNLNVKSIFYITQGLTPLLEKGSTNVDPGRVIIIASTAGLSSQAEGTGVSAAGNGLWSYNTTKAAAIHLGKTLAVTLVPKKITVNMICPGVFPSRMTRFGIKEHGSQINESQPMGRIGAAEDMAGIFTFLVSRAGAHVTGSVTPIDGGASIYGKKYKAKA